MPTLQMEIRFGRSLALPVHWATTQARHDPSVGRAAVAAGTNL